MKSTSKINLATTENMKDPKHMLQLLISEKWVCHYALYPAILIITFW